MNIEFCKHNIEEEDIHEVINTLKSMFISTSEKTELFENELAKYTENNYSLGLTSCTAALFLIIKALDFPSDSEIIVPALSFCASANTIIHAGAKPVFVDVEAETGNIDINQIEKKITKKTKAILIVHLYGQMCDMKEINIIAEKYNLKIIEDSAHCLEGKRENYRPGNLSSAAAFSFYATKNITSGEGGAICLNDNDLYQKIKILRLHGLTQNAYNRYHLKNFSQYDMIFPGYKYNMFDIQAALLINQLKRIDTNLKKREQIWNIYDNAFKDYVERPKILSNTTHARHLYTIWVNKNKRDKIINNLFNEGIKVSVHFYPIPLLSFYRKNFGFKEGDFPVCEDISAKTITLPLYPKLTNNEIDYIIEKTLKYIKN